MAFASNEKTKRLTLTNNAMIRAQFDIAVSFFRKGALAPV